MRVVGYVRESADPSVGAPAFSQQEALRRHCDEHGYSLVAICQDLRQPLQPGQRDGYLSMLGVVAAGGVDAVLLPGIEALSSDSIVQEIAIWDLQSRGVRVVSTEKEDLPLLDPLATQGPSRMLIRDVLERVSEHSESLEATTTPAVSVPDETDVVVRLIEADRSEQQGRATADGA